ncbi:transposase [Gorillibacterium sp. CAU 1737]|uniref:transposase n=1 Tax=Gorillibacterium sp. CAU 1737 TaxID=3140362 RepID=UPI003260000F
MIKVAQTVKKHQSGILRWFTSRLTNGLLEGDQWSGSGSQTPGKRLPKRRQSDCHGLHDR